MSLCMSSKACRVYEGPRRQKGYNSGQGHNLTLNIFGLLIVQSLVKSSHYRCIRMSVIQSPALCKFPVSPSDPPRICTYECHLLLWPPHLHLFPVSSNKKNNEWSSGHLPRNNLYLVGIVMRYIHHMGIRVRDNTKWMNAPELLHWKQRPGRIKFGCEKWDKTGVQQNRVKRTWGLKQRTQMDPKMYLLFLTQLDHLQHSIRGPASSLLAARLLSYLSWWKPQVSSFHRWGNACICFSTLQSSVIPGCMITLFALWSFILNIWRIF